jgi:hypothetical protein
MEGYIDKATRITLSPSFVLEGCLEFEARQRSGVTFKPIYPL